MKFIVLNFISFIIAMSALRTNYRFEIMPPNEGTDAFSSLPLIKFDHMKGPTEKGSNNPEILNFILGERAVFADLSKLPMASFLYYLPIHSLYRLKDFFLLI